jgi:hypothetical protein
VRETIREILIDDPSKAERDIRLVDQAVRAAVIYAGAESFQGRGPEELRGLIDAASSSVPILILAVTGSGAIPVGLPKAFHLCYISEEIHLQDNGTSLAAAEAVDSGLVNGALNGEQVKKTAMDKARTIADLAPVAVRSCAEAVRNGVRTSLDSGLVIELNLFCRLFSTSDMREGTQAFLEKRAPVFDGE